MTSSYVCSLQKKPGKLTTMTTRRRAHTLQSFATIVVITLTLLSRPTPITAAIDNVAFQWTNLLNAIWCQTGATFTSGIQQQLHLAQWHALLALRATGDCTTEDAVVAFASHKVLTHYFNWAQDFVISPFLDQQLRTWRFSARQKRLAKRLGEAVAVSLIAKRSTSNEFALGAVKDALFANAHPAIGVFRFLNDTPPDQVALAFDNVGLEKPFVIPAHFVSEYLSGLKPVKIPSAEWDENWKALKDVGRIDWPGRTAEMNLIAHLIGCQRANNSICSREQVATASAQVNFFTLSIDNGENDTLCF